MKLTNVALYSDSPFGIGVDVINFSLEHTHEDSQYQIRAITGLDAAEIIPKFYGFSTVTKQRYYTMGLPSREIVMRVVLNPRFENAETYSDIRDELYRAISATRTGIVMLHFSSGPNVIARIPGFIVKVEVGYFNQLPEVQITVRCDDPMFRGISPVVLTEEELGTGGDIDIGDNISTAPHGFTFKLTFTANTSDLTIKSTAYSPEWKFDIDMPVGGGFLTGDELYFSSEFNNKYLYMIRSSVTTHLMDRIEPQSVWPILFPGANHFIITDAANHIIDEIEYYPAYWGI